MILFCFNVIVVLLLDFLFIVFFFKQKTAYEMRISDWSSDVCSSDLSGRTTTLPRRRPCPGFWPSSGRGLPPIPKRASITTRPTRSPRYEIGRASCRERVCQYV